MVEFKLHTREQLIEALRRNKRLGVKRDKQEIFEQKQKDEFKGFLEWYVFDKIGTSPQNYIGLLETQFYAEQNFRDRRQRNIDFARGRQFNEAVWDNELKRWVTQWQYLRRRNMPPLTYNVVSKLVRSLVGQFREINTGNIVKSDSKDDRGVELANLLTVCVNRIKKRNRAQSKDAQNFKEVLLSGRPVYKTMWGSKDNMGKPDVRFRIVNTAKFMVNPGITDYDLENLHTITEIHDTSLNDIITNFASGDYERGMEIRQAYINYQGNEVQKSSYSNQSFDGNQLRYNTFSNGGIGNVSAYRYYEVWKLISDYEAITYDPLDGIGTTTVHKWSNPAEIKRQVDEENEKRRMNAEGLAPDEEYLIRFRADFVSRWFVIYLTPWGSVLDVRESPYKNGRAPYVFPAPDINGEVWGIVEEVLNAQLSLDRQILQADAIVANASKGVWLIPDTAVPDEWDDKEYIQELKKTDGAVIYKVRDGAEDIIPKQIHANAANVAGNVQQLIQLYSNLVDEISGNYGAAQGRDSSSKTATGYALESQNAGLNVRDIMENYLTMLVDRDEKALQFILEGYTKADFERVTGIPIDPKELEIYEFYIEQSKGTNSPAHRLALEQELLDLVYKQLLPFDVFLEVSNNPVMIHAKQKYEEWKKQQAMAQQGMMGQGEDVQQVPDGGAGEAPGLAVPQGERLSIQGHPQAEFMKEQAIKQQLPKLPGLNR